MVPINLDAAATTPLLPEAWEAMRAFAFGDHGNPSSSHRHGRRARQALEDARERIAFLLDAHPDEVVFTSGATEANNLALLGAAGETPARLIASPIEHPCVVEPLEQLRRRGFAVEHLPVGIDGTVPAEADVPADARLVALQLVNHETGAVQPVGELSRRRPTTLLHCDAAQAVGRMPVRFHELGAATLSFSAHKFHGPEGVGGLLVRRGTELRPMLFGGHQQRGRRPGTEATGPIVGMAAALDAACRDLERRSAHVVRLREEFLRGLDGEGVVNGPSSAGSPHIVNVSFPGLKSDIVLAAFDLEGVSCSTGSACSSGSLLPSPVLRAMGIPDDRLRSAMRFSFHAMLSIDEVREASRRVAAVVARLRHVDE